jgi:hypothetical protein
MVADGGLKKRFGIIQRHVKSTLQIVCLTGLAALVAGCGPVAIPPTTTATGTNAHTIDEVALEVKGDYHMRSPETPPHLTNQPSVVPAAQLSIVQYARCHDRRAEDGLSLLQSFTLAVARLASSVAPKVSCALGSDR